MRLRTGEVARRKTDCRQSGGVRIRLAKEQGRAAAHGHRLHHLPGTARRTGYHQRSEDVVGTTTLGRAQRSACHARHKTAPGCHHTKQAAQGPLRTERPIPYRSNKKGKRDYHPGRQRRAAGVRRGLLHDNKGVYPVHARPRRQERLCRRQERHGDGRRQDCCTGRTHDARLYAPEDTGDRPATLRTPQRPLTLQKRTRHQR